ncbi:non-specific lipid transfer protein GPI-anchored 30 [Rhodamnia argentea]|uniref:Non-specific lipid transfer protein GPI-anchored 30 n=1 Tax=Rhodamnia argentea TaxID=178133 RepID=A0A8B8QZZ9_9MYRT|nr:non-specific lipid transfer protein GPI-anchored 30 [Rhodamnia argentea]
MGSFTEKMERRNIRAGLETAALVLAALLVVDAQAQDTSCLSQLAPCLNYLNGTRDPPSACCDPLKSVISSDPGCLCSLISNQGAAQAEQAGINVTEAQRLPGRCGQNVNPIACLSGSPSSGNSDENAAGLFPGSSLRTPMAIIALSVAARILWD